MSLITFFSTVFYFCIWTSTCIYLFQLWSKNFSFQFCLRQDIEKTVSGPEANSIPTQKDDTTVKYNDAFGFCFRCIIMYSGHNKNQIIVHLDC